MFFQQPQARPNPLNLMLHSAAERFGSDYLQQQQHQKENQLISEAFKDISEDTSPLQVLTKISGLNVSPDKKQMLFEGFKNISAQKALAQKAIQQQGQLTQKSQDELARSKRIAEHYGLSEDEIKDLKPADVAALGKQKGKTRGAPEDLDLLEKEMIDRGLPPAWARLYSRATEGGRTQILKDYFTAKQRMGAPGQFEQTIPEISQQAVPQQFGQEQEVAPSPQEKLVDYDKGLTEAERVKRQEARYKTQLPIYEEEVGKSKTLENESTLLERLASLNEDKGLFTMLDQWNIDKDGKLRYPFLASAEAQLFEKTVNEFTSGAKDTFGGRVTNFDLDQFKQRLPRLLNSQAGRNLIIKQMKVINGLNQLHTKALLKEIEKHGGIRNIDMSQARENAEKSIKNQKSQFLDKFRDIESFANEARSDKVYWAKQRAPAGMIMMRKGKDSYEYIPKEKVNAAKQKGYELI